MRLTRTTRLSLLVLLVLIALLLVSTSWISRNLPPNAVSLTPVKPSFTLGEPVELEVINHTNQTLRVENKCPEQPLEVAYESAGYWREQEAKADGIGCADAFVELKPNEVRRLSYLPWQAKLFTQPGSYRVELEVEGYETRYRTTFAITSK